MNQNSAQDQSPLPATDQQPSGSAAPADQLCPPFVPQTLRRQMMLDAALTWLFRALLMVMACLAVFEATYRQAVPEAGLSLLLIAFAAGWIIYGLSTSRVAQQLPQITELIDVDPPLAEAMLAAALRRWPLQRSVRLMLYHRLAMLRRRGERFAETAAICQTVLLYPLGQARAVKGHLLLMLAESHLYCRDLWGAWSALSGLHHCKLSVAESLQRTALQTRYEVEAGYDATAMQQLHQKVAMAELMPAPQCAAVHAMLATAAQRSEQTHVADWLRQRAQLLADPEQLSRLWPQYETGGEKLDFDESGA